MLRDRSRIMCRYTGCRAAVAVAVAQAGAPSGKPPLAFASFWPGKPPDAPLLLPIIPLAPPLEPSASSNVLPSSVPQPVAAKSPKPSTDEANNTIPWESFVPTEWLNRAVERAGMRGFAAFW